MIHIAYIDDSTPKGQTIIKQLQKEPKVVRFDNPVNTSILPDGYMSGTDFRAEVKQGLKSKLKVNGYL
jgi:hypothetical protein